MSVLRLLIAVLAAERLLSLRGVHHNTLHILQHNAETTPLLSDALRLSVGLESIQDILADLKQALDGCDDGL